MMFELNEVQIDYISKKYCVSSEIIRDIELNLNSLVVIREQRQLFELVCKIISQYKTKENCDINNEKLKIVKTIKELIINVMNEQYSNNENIISHKTR